MDDLRRWVNLAFLFGAIILWWLFANMTSSVLGILNIFDTRILGELVTMSTLIGGAIAIILVFALWRNVKIYESSLNVAREMKKVTWPNFEETKQATKVVIVTTIIVALILSGFDLVFKWLTDLILGV